jgi:hypothetical protein
MSRGLPRGPERKERPGRAGEIDRAEQDKGRLDEPEEDERHEAKKCEDASRNSGAIERYKIVACGLDIIVTENRNQDAHDTEPDFGRGWEAEGREDEVWSRDEGSAKKHEIDSNDANTGSRSVHAKVPPGVRAFGENAGMMWLFPCKWCA